jgi:hypothetical protein
MKKTCHNISQTLILVAALDSEKLTRAAVT